MKFTVYGRSELGPRKQNEDSFGTASVVSGELIAVIADGVGGRRAGHIASRHAVDAFITSAVSNVRADPVEVVTQINQMLIERQEQEESLFGMSTTLTGVILAQGYVIGAHAGDSRAVLLRGNGIKRLTEDHTELNRLKKAGLITNSEAVHYPRKNVIESALGILDEPQIDIIEHELLSGDRLLLTTDGVHGVVFLRELRNLSLENSSAENFVDAIVSTVQERGAEDNFTCICIDVM